MRCQRCEKQATFHITELTGGSKPQELHLCEEHARDYLTHPSADQVGQAAGIAGALAQQLAVGQAAEDLARLDQRACPVCGITFFEFRNQGRLGCAHDYVCFAKEIEPLIVNIHGDHQNRGKKSARFPDGTEPWTNLIRLRRDMQAAVADEDYEKAKELRDEIRRLEAQATVAEQ